MSQNFAAVRNIYLDKRRFTMACCNAGVSFGRPDAAEFRKLITYSHWGSKQVLFNVVHGADGVRPQYIYSGKMAIK